MRAPRWLAVGLTLTLTQACREPEEQPPPAITDPTTSEPDGPTFDPCTVGGAPRSPLRRLNRDEYDNTVRDLLGLDLKLARTFPPDALAFGFDNNADTQDVSPSLAQAWADAAEKLAAQADLSRLLPCTPEQRGGRSCALEFVETFGHRAFRRPLASDELERYAALLDATSVTSDFDVSVRTVIEVMLQSPQFLYRLEPMGAQEPLAERVALSGYEVASRLSYFLWSTMPDEVLLQAASEGKLDTIEGIEVQARRMIADERARSTLRRFALQWLGLTGFDLVAKDPEQVPEFESVKPHMIEEAALFVEHAMLEGPAGRLFDGQETWVNEPLATYYGLIAPQGETFQRYSTFRTARTGLLTLGAVLSRYARRDQSSPTLRGRFIREKLLCQILPDPPGNVVLELPPATESTTRERFAAHSRDPACGGCHKLLEPVGFGLERFDAAGRWRNFENGQPVDASGEIVGTRHTNGPFEDHVALSQLLAKSEDVQDCLALQWYRYALGRGELPASPVDACALKQIRERYSASGHRVPELLVAITTSDAFRFRAPVATEEAP